MKEAFKKAIIPSCFVSLMGLPFALVGGIVFFILALLVLTIFFYFHGKIVPKEYLSEEETIEMCQEYIKKIIDTNNKEFPKKSGKLTLKKIHHNKTDNTLLFSFDYTSSHGINDAVNDFQELLRKTLSKCDLDENKLFIACVYTDTSFKARIKYANGNDNYYSITMTCAEMKEILSTWHPFGSEYSWL